MKGRGPGQRVVLVGRGALIEPLQKGEVLANVPGGAPLGRTHEDLARFGDPTGARERVRVAGRDLVAVGRAFVGALQPDDGLGGAPERDVEQVAKVVRVPGVLRRAGQRVVVRVDGEVVVAEQSLAEAERGPAAVVVGPMREHATRAERRAPRMALDEQLGRVPPPSIDELRRLDERVPLRSGLTLADRLGGWPEAVLTALTILALAWAIVRAVTERRRRGAPGTTRGSTEGPTGATT